MFLVDSNTHQTKIVPIGLQAVHNENFGFNFAAITKTKSTSLILQGDGWQKIVSQRSRRPERLIPLLLQRKPAKVTLLDAKLVIYSELPKMQIFAC